MSPRYEQWKPALIYGWSFALVHRAVLQVWMTALWLLAGAGLQVPEGFFLNLPELGAVAQAVLGIYRRWDAVQYLMIAERGYPLEHPGASVFGVLYPLAVHILNLVLPGGVDLAAYVCSTVCFATALTLLYRLCQVYYRDVKLARTAVLVVAVFPTSHFFAAPYSESLYLALVLGAFYLGLQRRWFAASLTAAFGVLTRSVGAVMAGVLAWMLLEQVWARRASMWEKAKAFILLGWPLILVPVFFLAFTAYRSILGFPPLRETYRVYAYLHFVDPLQGIHMAFSAASSFLIDFDLGGTVDAVALFLLAALALAAFFSARHKRSPLVLYTVANFLAMVSRQNTVWGTDIPSGVNTASRYVLVFFPTMILIADAVRKSPRIVKLLHFSISAALLFFFSALYVFYL